MSENYSSKKLEAKERKYSSFDLTPLEHVMIGSSGAYSIEGKTIGVTSKNIAGLAMDKQARKVVLSPISLAKDKENLDEIIKARSEKDFLYAMTILDTESFLKYLEKQISPAFRLGKLDENGQLKELRVFFLSNDKKIDLEKDVLTNFIINQNFESMIENSGIEDNEIRLTIKDLKR
jgi:hypothetical protein